MDNLQLVNMKFGAKYWLILWGVFSGSYYAQDKKIDKLEMLYDQGHYINVYRKSKKLQRKKVEYKKSTPVLLFQALSEYQLAKDKKKFSKEKAIQEFRTFKAKDTIGEYSIMYADYIYDMKLAMINEIKSLQEKKNVEKAKEIYQTYISLFGNTHSYEQITEAVQEETPAEGKIEEQEEFSNDNTTEVHSTKKIQKHIIKEAKKLIGKPYKFGGTTPKGFDCSGFTQYVYAKNNLTLPRTSGEQAVYAKRDKLKNAEIGDLVFFGKNKNSVNHVGIISKIEGDKVYMVHASTSRGIMETEITTNVYWSKRLLFITKNIKSIQ